MNKLGKTLIFLASKDDLEILENLDTFDEMPLIFSFNIWVHKLLEAKNITHKIGETYLEKNDHVQIFDKTTSLWEWYTKKDIFNTFKFENVNLFGLLDTFEFHNLIIRKLLLFVIIKRIIEKENPDKIIASNHFFHSINFLIKDKNIDLISHEKIEQIDSAPWDNYILRLKLIGIPITISISRKKYTKIKNFVELITSSLFGLWFNFKTDKQIILFVEFNPLQYAELISKLKNYNRTVVFLNIRRPSIEGLTSIRFLKNLKCKIVNVNNFLNSTEKTSLKQITKDLQNKLTKLWKNDDDFNDIFSIDGLSFWNLINSTLFNLFYQRTEEYVQLIFFIKKLQTNADISCIASLNVLGDTEKAILNIIPNKPSILFEHSFSNYLPEIKNYDLFNMYTLFPDKISLWGDIQKDYLIKHRQIHNEKIFVTGSARHDKFVNKKSSKKSNSKLTILLTPQNLDESLAISTTNSYLKLEKLLKQIFMFIKKFPNVKLIVKLHPAQDPGTEYIKKLIHKLDQNITIYQSESIFEVFDLCDVMINIQTELFPSTVLLEGLILKKPILNISISEIDYLFEFEKDNAVASISHNSNFEIILEKILFDSKTRDNLIKNGTIYVHKYLKNPGFASESLANILNSL